MKKMPNITPDKFPPYGLLHEGFAKRLREQPLVPPDWDAGPNCDLQCREEQWLAFRSGTLKLIHSCLWPHFNREKRKWEGGATAQMHKLTEADFGLIRRLQAFPLPALALRPGSPVKSIDCPNHRGFYDAEDDRAKDFLELYANVDRTLEPNFAFAFRSPNGEGLGSKVAGASLQFKMEIQRPRPYQIAYIYGADDLTNEFSAKAGSPSMSSGHALQGMLGVGSIMERLLMDGHTVSDESWTALEQHAVDIGDRRVFAGVHYPSDNIASWIIGLLMGPKVYRRPEVPKRLWTAVNNRSVVYKLIKEAARTPAGRVYRKPLAELDAIGRAIYAS